MESLQRLNMRKPLARILRLCTRTNEFSYLLYSSDPFGYNNNNNNRTLAHGAKHSLILYGLPPRRLGGYMLLN